MLSEFDPYFAALDLQPGASPEAIKQAYQALAQRWRPDQFADDPERQREAAARFQDIQDAYVGLQFYMRRMEVSQAKSSPQLDRNRVLAMPPSPVRGQPPKAAPPVADPDDLDDETGHAYWETGDAEHMVVPDGGVTLDDVSMEWLVRAGLIAVVVVIIIVMISSSHPGP